MNRLLIDKHRPRYLDDFNLEKSYIEYIDQITLNTDLNILLFGNTGSGKTGFIDAIIYKYYGVTSLSNVKNNILSISNLKDQGIAFYKADVKTFCQSTSEIPNRKKIIIIDNLDTMSEINQNIFKIHMERYGKRVLFLCSCTSINKISAAILNHFVVIKMKPIDASLLNYCFNKIINLEGLYIKPSIKSHIIRYSNNSIKLLVNNLEKYRIMHDSIEYRIENINNNILAKELLEFYAFICDNDRGNSYQKLLTIYNDGYSIIDIIEYMYANLKYNDDIILDKKYAIIKILSKYLLLVNNTNEDEVILYFLANDIIDKIQ